LQQLASSDPSRVAFSFQEKVGLMPTEEKKNPFA